jgi:predicted nucleic acid-binding protein
MRLILDAGPMIAQVQPKHPHRVASRRVLDYEREPSILSPFIATEVDFFLQELRGPKGNVGFLRDLASARFEVPTFEPSDFKVIAALNQQYADLGAGLADLSIVVLAQRYRTTRILTLDQRHFRTLKPLQGGTFVLLPFDDDTDS